MTIKKALDLLPDKVGLLIKEHEKDLDQAWVKTEKDITITFSASLSVRQGQNTCELTMSFTKEKIKDKTKFVWDDRQDPLPFKKKEKEKE